MKLLRLLPLLLIAFQAQAQLVLEQATASQAVMIGPFVDSTDGVTAETGLTIANTDVRLSANGGNMAAKNSGGCTHDEIGYYTCTFDATDTATVGRLQVMVAASGALPVYHEFIVVEEAVHANFYDASAVGPLTAAAVNAEADTALADYDAPTNAELTARTLAAAAYFDFTTDAVDVGTIETVDATDQLDTAAATVTVTSIGSGVITEASFDTTAGSFDPLQIVDQGTAQSATGTTLQLRAAAAFADDELIGATIVITGGSAGVGQARIIEDYVSSTDTATVPTWTTTPSGTITYKVFGTAPGTGGSVSISAGGITASSFAAGAIDASAIATAAIGAAEIATDAIGADELAANSIGQSELDSTAGGFPQLGIIDQGTAQAATSSTLQLRAAAGFADDEIIGATCLITGGSTGVGQSRSVTDYVSSTDTATVETWTTTPTGTVTYVCYGTAPGASGSLTQADVRTAVGLASANLDTQLSTIDTNVDSILVDTSTTLDNFVDDLETRLGTPSDLGGGATVAANLADIEGQTDDIGAAGAGLTAITTPIATAQADLDIVTGTNGVLVDDDAITAAKIAADAIGASEIAADAITSSEIGATAASEIQGSQVTYLSLSACDSGTTTTCVDATLTEADTDYWRGVAIRFTSGTISGQTRCVVAFTPASDTLTFVPPTTQAVGTNTYLLVQDTNCIGVDPTYTP